MEPLQAYKMDLSAELKELRKQLYTYRYKSLELERQLRTHCNAFHNSLDSREKALRGKDEAPVIPIYPFEATTKGFIDVFANGLILELITSHLPVQDLLRCRLVCKPWAREMAQYLTKRKALVVAYEDCSEARELMKKKQAGKLVNISTLCILEISITSAIIVDIVKLFGETLSGLKLDDCNPGAAELRNLLKVLPSLEVLSFKQTGVRRRRRPAAGNAPDAEQPNPSRLDGLTEFYTNLEIHSLKKLVWEEMQPVKFFERIIKMFPKLEELELLCWSKPEESSLTGLKLDSLKYLTLSCDNNFSEANFKALASLKLKLKKLILHDLKPESGGAKIMRGLKLFLRSISNTVTEMSLNGTAGLIEASSSKSFVGQPTPFPISFPVLQKLEIDCSLMTNLGMVDHIPKLEKLECKFKDWKGWWHLLNKNGPAESHPELKDLALGSIDSGCLLKIGRCFNSITKLDVMEDRIDDVAFRVITGMSQLSHLRITASTNAGGRRLNLTDSGFTGIPRDECEKLLTTPQETCTPEYLDNLRKYSYIGNLKALYSLELACSELSITDISVLFGIAELPRVSTITLPNCKLSNSSLDAFSEMSGLLVLELHRGCGVTKEAVTSLRTKKKDLVFNLYSDLNSRIFS